MLLRGRRSSSIKRALEAENQPKCGPDGQTSDDTNERPVPRTDVEEDSLWTESSNGKVGQQWSTLLANDRCLASQPSGQGFSRQGFRKRTYPCEDGASLKSDGKVGVLKIGEST